MIHVEASEASRAVLRTNYATLSPGVTYYVLRDGKPFVDASFGQARRNGAADGALKYSADTIVHLASVSKFICAVAVMRLIEDWNGIVADLRPTAKPGFYKLAGEKRLPIDDGLIKSVRRHQRQTISLDTRVYDLMKAHLDHAAIANYEMGYPGTGVTDITLRQLLTHTSGIRDGKMFPERLGLTMGQINNENDPSGKAFFDLRRYISVLFSQDTADRVGSYSNDGYNVLGAFVQFLTGTPFEAWCRVKIFPTKAFDDIARRPVDMGRAARYYERDANGNFTVGNHHPDYADFGACGGWYASASALCAWTHAVMSKRSFGGTASASAATIPAGAGRRLRPLPKVALLRLGRPILSEPNQLFELGLGFDGGSLDLGYLHGRAKNGGTGTPGGSTNCRLVYLDGYGSYSVVAFAQANCAVDANPLLEAGLPPLRRWLYDPTPLPDRPVFVQPRFDAPGLSRTAFWEDAGKQQTAQDAVQLTIQPASVPGVTPERTNMFGATPYAPGRSANQPVFVRLSGYLRVAEAGTYRLQLSSDDGAMLWSGETLVIDNDRHQGMASATGQFTATAYAAVPIMIDWYNLSGFGGLYLEWQRPGTSAFEPIPVDAFRQGLLKLPPLGDGGRPLPL